MLDFDEAARLRELGDALERAGLCRLWSHPDFLNRALKSILEWSDPAGWKRRRRAVSGAPAPARSRDARPAVVA